MRVKTLPQAVIEAQKKDPVTALNKFMLSSLIREKKIPYGNHGNRTVVDYDLIVPAINALLEFSETDELPRLRTIRSAVEELRETKPEIGFGEEHIRTCVLDGRIASITVGNRRYIAMESFETPHCERILSGHAKSFERQEMIRNDIMEQMGNAISAQAYIPKVTRVRGGAR